MILKSKANYTHTHTWILINAYLIWVKYAMQAYMHSPIYLKYILFHLYIYIYIYSMKSELKGKCIYICFE